MDQNHVENLQKSVNDAQANVRKGLRAESGWGAFKTMKEQLLLHLY
ncbi:MAG: hypothetical protein ACRC7P_03700 [Enterovibrio sp.]